MNGIGVYPRGIRVTSQPWMKNRIEHPGDLLEIGRTQPKKSRRLSAKLELFLRTAWEGRPTWRSYGKLGQVFIFRPALTA